MKKRQNKNNPEFHTFESYQPQHQPIDRPKGSRIKQINAWLHGHRKLVLGTLIAFILLIGGSIIYLFHSLEFASIPEVITKKKVVEKIYSPLTGVEVSEEDSKRPVTGVMVENSPEARPQSGLKEAGVVFESVAEGGITRFLLLYQEAKPAQIGPVRSVRPQFASWVAAFDAGLAHVGGSDIPLQKLRSGKIKDLDQFFNAGAYTRVTNRAAPHNVYTTDEKLQALNRAKNYNNSNFTSWKRKKKEAPAETPTASSINIPVSTPMHLCRQLHMGSSHQYLPPSCWWSCTYRPRTRSDRTKSCDCYASSARCHP
ncbi:MAG: DUF3048 domain-containing protein [Candidatus Saccharimonadales bacterium]